ncbi:MAG: hypothetical protein M1472_01680, partial [Planctomycetes bacterium]|nr:hypothetical protein [Planctomycetota bacterium]
LPVKPASLLAVGFTGYDGRSLPRRHDVTTSNEQIIIATPVLLSAAQRLITHYLLLIAVRPQNGRYW